MPHNCIAIGQKVKRFREARDLTQQQLELEAGLSSGHISRIESGKVNPTKELLLQISNVLKLNIKERLFLLDLNSEPITKEEVKSVAKYANEYFSSTENPVYLADDFWFTWTGNKKMVELIGGPTDDSEMITKFVDQVGGTHVLEWLFNPELGVKDRIPKQLWEEICINQAIYFINLVDYFNRKGQSWLNKLFEKLDKFEKFDDVWKEAEKRVSNNIFRNELIVTFDFQGDWYEFFIANTHINNLPRFMLVEYVPCKIYKNGDINQAVKL